MPEPRASEVIVPLGVDCSIAHYARSRGLRQTAFPFDWTVTPFSSAIQLLENSFTDFLHSGNLVYLSPEKRLLFKEDSTTLETSDDVITPVICKKYGMLFPHDFSAKGRDDYGLVKQKYDVRCERLLKLIQANGPVLFVFNARELNDWQKRQYAATGVALPEFPADGLSTLSGALQRLNANLQFSILSLEELKQKFPAPARPGILAGFLKRITKAWTATVPGR